MSEANQYNPNTKSDVFENRNFLRRAVKAEFAKLKEVSRPDVLKQKADPPKFERNFGEPKVSRPQGTTAPEPKPTQLVPLNLRLSTRDFGILEFVLDMKFASRDEIFEKFFFRRQDQEIAKSNRWCLERLSQLEKAGFLKGVKSFSEATRYFLGTEKAHLALNQRIQNEKIPKEMKTIDQRIFIHDKLVLKTRLEFEKANPEGRWISDRRLRSGLASVYHLPSEYIPDAIYETSSGEKVAFEFENAPKSRKDYGEKIRYFAKLIELKKNDPNMFTRVRFRCVRPDVYRFLKEETASYTEGLFTVELWESEFAKEGGGVQPVPKTAKPVKTVQQQLDEKRAAFDRRDVKR